MKRQLPIRCRIPDGNVKDEIQWLEIRQADGGFYLLQYVDIEWPPKWDVYSDDLEGLLDDCVRIWNVQRDAWRDV